MWKLKIPPKWKTFLCRAICDILPTMDNLIIKRVEVSPACPMCDLGHENVLHALISCDYSRRVWNVSQLPVTNIVVHSFPLWLMGIFNALTEEQVGMVVGVLYHIWRARNSAVWDKALAAAAFRQVHQRQQSTPPSAVSTPPTHARLKCGADAGYKQTTGDATYGMVSLGHDGSFVAAKCGKLHGAFSPLMAEALASSFRLLLFFFVNVRAETTVRTLALVVVAESSSLEAFLGNKAASTNRNDQK
ncbi:PREDICTED: uncharacterized protein LOC109168240 [Ipomoea nil]|uniref:uncharacterized protein LOC109168240 n=1 Tax=Ipomoea nil TaxID=35883 RepID=UPI000900D039|nr:PREDICTED: uncharacterized protein LOC109168240 [Ipomoea nil]